MLGFILLLGLVFPHHSMSSIPSAFVEGFADIVEKVRPAVVNVAVTGGGGGGGRQLPPGPFGGPPGPASWASWTSSWPSGHECRLWGDYRFTWVYFDQ